MDTGLYRAAQEGDLGALKGHIQHFSTELTTTRNTPLHVVVYFNDSWECTEEILKTNESLLFEVNSYGNSAFHIAARNGRSAAGSTMITWAKRSNEDVESGGGILKKLLTIRNRNGDTPLHEAIMGDQPEMVVMMLQDYPEIANIVNNSLETPLFLAACQRRIQCMIHILEYCLSPAYTGPKGRTTLHAVAAICDRKEIAEELIKKHPTSIKEVDDFGWSALHYAARHGSDIVAQVLLQADESIAYIVVQKDDNKTALHLATCEGNVELMREILRYCPSCWEMVTSDGQNVLHLAVKFEEEKAFKYILKQSWVVNLINENDAEGNTPLHLYAVTVNFQGADLVNHPQADQNAVNKKNMTPLDVITNCDSFSVRKDFIKKELERTDALIRMNLDNRDYRSRKMKIYEQTKRMLPRDFRKRGETQMVVAALIMTITFAARFTTPGVYTEEDGMAILSRKMAFRVFVISDTLASIFSGCAVIFYLAAASVFSRLKLARWYFAATMLVILAAQLTLIACMFRSYAILEISETLGILFIVICSLQFPALCCTILFSGSDENL